MKRKVKIGETQLAMSELKMSMQEIKDHNLHADGWNEGYEEAVNDKSKEEWLIWSIEHGCWWRPDSRGYCAEVSGAGIYSYERALEIVKGANYSLTLKKPKKHDSYLNTPHEAMILLTPELKEAMENPYAV